MVRSLLPRAIVFLLSALGGALLVFAIAALIGPGEAARGQAAATPAESPGGGDLPGDGSPADPFSLTELSTDPIALPTLAPDARLAVAEETDGAADLARPDGSGLPRVTPISQFDGGRLEAANCTMAAGAMLAQVAFGIVTTGSILRSLQDDQDGGTSFSDLRTALERGYGVRPAVGAITPGQLRSLLSAGFAVAISGRYGELRPPYSLQPSFTGGHAIYVDGYFPGDAVVGEAFYVIDPLHAPYSGYRGTWWPAELLERFALVWEPARRIHAIWAFPAGATPPRVPRPPDLPPIPEPDDVPPAAPDPAEEPGIDEPAEPSTADADTDDGEEPSLGDPPSIGGYDIGTGFGLCLGRPPPDFCPDGILGTFRLGGGPGRLSGSPEVEVLWVDSDRPNLMRIGFTAEPPDSTVDVHYWLADGPIEVQTAPSILPLTLGGRPQLVATLPVLAEATYHFQVFAENDGAVTTSEIGTFTSGGGLVRFEIDVRDAADPSFDVSDLLPYSQLVADGLAPPLLPCDVIDDAAGGISCELATVVATETGLDEPIRCRSSIGTDDASFCLDPISVPDDALADACEVAAVSYAVDGLDVEGVIVRATPEDPFATPDGSVSLRPVLEALSSSSSGIVELGCLAPGVRYHVTIDAVGDLFGVLATEMFTVP